MMGQIKSYSLCSVRMLCQFLINLCNLYSQESVKESHVYAERKVTVLSTHIRKLQHLPIGQALP